jgi:hypothetical protein
LLGFGEDGGRTIGQDDVGHAGESRCTDGRSPPGGLSLVGEMGQEGAISQRFKRNNQGVPPVAWRPVRTVSPFPVVSYVPSLRVADIGFPCSA